MPNAKMSHMKATNDINNIPSKSFSRRKIVSNWSKYDELPPEAAEDNNSDYFDFEFLSKNYSTDDNYFHLASEKEWSKPASAPTSELFALNLKNLSTGLACLPFYDRVDVNKALLPGSCIADCENEAKASLLKYKPELDKLRGKQECDIAQLHPTPTCNDCPDTTEVQETQSNVTLEEEKCSKEGTVNSKEEEDLEDWLDSVLDD